jgi:hypothetical protein
MLCVRAALTLAGVSILCTGCMVQSINPFYTKESLAAYPQAVGRWQLVKERGRDFGNAENKAAIDPWTIKALGGGQGAPTYEVTSFDGNNREGKLSAAFFTVGGETYCDITSPYPPNASYYVTTNLFQVHMLFKVELKEEVLRLRFIGRQWMQKALDSKELAFQVLNTRNRAVLLNATSEEWKSFLEKYGKTEGVFSDKDAMELKRIKDEPPAEGKPAEAKPARPERKDNF